MLKNERCVVAQLDAIQNLHAHQTPQIQTVLYDALRNDKFFYKVRARAARYLTEVCNQMPGGLLEQSKTTVISFFQDKYGCNSDPRIPALNNFVATSSNLQSYFLMVVRSFKSFSTHFVLGAPGCYRANQTRRSLPDRCCQFSTWPVKV